jgi:hypothetical protein
LSFVFFPAKLLSQALECVCLLGLCFVWQALSHNEVLTLLKKAMALAEALVNKEGYDLGPLHIEASCRMLARRLENVHDLCTCCLDEFSSWILGDSPVFEVCATAPKEVVGDLARTIIRRALEIVPTGKGSKATPDEIAILYTMVLVEPLATVQPWLMQLQRGWALEKVLLAVAPACALAMKVLLAVALAWALKQRCESLRPSPRQLSRWIQQHYSKLPGTTSSLPARTNASTNALRT